MLLSKYSVCCKVIILNLFVHYLWNECCYSPSKSPTNQAQILSSDGSIPIDSNSDLPSFCTTSFGYSYRPTLFFAVARLIRVASHRKAGCRRCRKAHCLATWSLSSVLSQKVWVLNKIQESKSLEGRNIHDQRSFLLAIIMVLKWLISVCKGFSSNRLDT
jgi:hypothetical protein